MASVRKRSWKGPKGEQKEAWVVTYTNRAKKREQKTFDRKKDADRFRSEVETDLRVNKHLTGDGVMTFRALTDRYAAEARARMERGEISRVYVELIASRLRVHLLPLHGSKRIEDIGIEDVEKTIRVLRAKGLAPRSIGECMAHFKMMMAYAVRCRYITISPVPSVLDAETFRSKKVETFSTEQMTRLLATVAVKPAKVSPRSHMKLQIAVNLAAFCGLRLGEIFGLRRQDIDFDNDMILVRKSLNQWDEVQGPKTEAGIREVPMPSHIRALLDQWFDLHYIERDRCLVFTATRPDRRQEDRGFNRFAFHTVWRHLLVRAGLADKVRGKGLHFHALRHFAASSMVSAGIPITDISRMIGHSGADITLKVYAHPLSDARSQRVNMQRIADGVLSQMHPT